MALVFAPAANAVLSSVRTDQAGQASGATNAIRELGGVLGVSVLATVFTSHGGYTSPQAFVNGVVPAVWVGAAVLAVGALVAMVLPFNTPGRGAGAAPRPKRMPATRAVRRQQLAGRLPERVIGSERFR